MNFRESGCPARPRPAYEKNPNPHPRRTRPSENLIRIDGENVSVSLLLQNPGLENAKERGSGRWCRHEQCRAPNRCNYLHRKQRHPRHTPETNTSAMQIVLELAHLTDPLGAILGDESKKQGFQNLLRITNATQIFLSIVQRMMASFDTYATPLSAELSEVCVWCDAWVIRCTEQIEKIHTWPISDQNCFFSLMYNLCERDPTSPDTRRGLEEVSKLSSISSKERQRATELLQNTESNIRMTEGGEENDEKQKRYVVNKMYHNTVIPAFDSVVWPSSATELRSFFSELIELPGLVVDRFIPRELRGLHLRVLQHLSRADFMYSLNNVATIVQENSSDALKTNPQQHGFKQHFHVYHLVFNHVSSNPYDGLLARFLLETKYDSQKTRFLSGDLVLLWQEGVTMNDENCFLAIVKMELDGAVALSPVDVLRCWPLLKSGARFVLVRSQNFYLPTAASLTQLRIQESKVTDDDEPILLRALITGDGATNPPTYLQENPPIELGCCVALEDGSESRQPALSDWPGREWSKEAEETIREESDGEKALLDRTQLDALQHIMRNQVAVVQGTPGTGKSFVGSKFLQMLLRNRKELGIGPIVVMTFTHHALESVFESLVPVALCYDVKIGLIGKTKSTGLASYVIPMRRQRSETAEAIIRVTREIDAIKSYTTVSEDSEDKILSVMAKHMDPDTYDEWKRSCIMPRENWLDKQKEYSELKKKVSDKLRIRIPDSLKVLEKMSLALKTKQWHGEVDIMPFLEANFQHEWGIYFDDIKDVLYEIADEKRNTPRDESFIADLVEEAEEYFSLLRYGRNNSILKYCIDTFVYELDKLIALMKQVPAACTPYMELWRLEGIGKGQTMPQLVDLTAAANKNTGVTNQTEAVDTQLEEFQREEEERRRQERDLDNDVTELSEDKHQLTFLSLPPKEERDALARDACNRMATAPPGEERSQLLSVLLREEIFSLQEKLNALVARLNDEKESLKKEAAAMNAWELSRCAVIGATSTKLMLSVDAIQSCGASVLVVEEAAEVLESHLFACVTESMQHVVLIGDHKQLKPKVNEYVLERRHNLAVSTMERMVLCGLPCVTLTMQRRMIPEISDLTKPYYRRTNVAGDTAVDIEDHPRTLNIPPPFGVCDKNNTPIRLFFLSHDGQGDKAESMRNTLTSPENLFEAKLVARIAQYLMNLNDKKSITILVPYTGQQFAMFRELELLRIPRRGKFIDSVTKIASNQGVRLSTVDDYQGEEDDIIILSLVRTEKPGFLRLDNRACVALSRARSALYVVGCGDMLSGASALWAHLEQTCRTKQCIGSRFPARCDHHPQHDLSFSSAAEYDMYRARCPEQCSTEMDCGHMCESRCHAKRQHPPCPKDCERVGHLCIPPRSCQHVCPKQCGVTCGKCMVPVDYTYPDCGHCVTLYCYQLDELPPCTVKYTQEADCGHEVEAPCVEHMNHTSLRRCKVDCNAHMSCGHVCRQKCHHNNDDNHVQAMAQCTQPLRAKAPCGHEVEHPCNRKDIASLCTEQCKKIVTSCRKEGDKSLCKLNCGHQESCDCMEKITVKLSCGHTSDSFNCASTAPPPICLAQCSATLECAHQCTGECGVCSERKFHSDCKEPGKALVCGHNSKLGCTATVNICEELCTFHCGHGMPCNKLGKAAQHKCSKCPSRMCIKPCQWQCPHGKCNKKCCEPCEFEITEDNTVSLSSGCWRRCEKKLPCGHRCCGLCGEQCPSFCRECYKAGNKKALALAEKVLTYIDNNKEEELETLRRDNSAEARSLVELPCCQMIFSSQELNNLFSSKAEGKEEISAITCPQCREIVLPKAFRHVGVFIKKRLLAASTIMKRISDAVKEQTEHGLKEVITYIKDELKFSKIVELNDIIETVRGLTQPKKRNANKMKSLIAVWGLFENSCTELGLGQKWIALLRYHLETLEKALGNLRKNDSRINHNANVLAETALRFTIMADALSTDVLISSSLKQFCAENVSLLVQTPNDLAKSFPSAQNDDEVKIFSERMEWTSLLCYIQLYTDLDISSLEENIEIGIYFATRGVRSDEVDRAESVKHQLKDMPKRGMKHAEEQYVAQALDLSAGHWFSCPNGHLYAIGECGGTTGTSVCHECGERIGGNNHTLLRDNRFAGGLFEDGAGPSCPTVLAPRPLDM